MDILHRNHQNKNPSKRNDMYAQQLKQDSVYWRSLAAEAAHYSVSTRSPGALGVAVWYSGSHITEFYFSVCRLFCGCQHGV